MMNFRLIIELQELSKLTFVDIKLKCVRISLKMGFAHTLTNANLLMGTINYLMYLQHQRKPIEPKNANHFGKKVSADMDSDANSPITSTKPTSKHNSWK